MEVPPSQLLAEDEATIATLIEIYEEIDEARRSRR